MRTNIAHDVTSFLPFEAVEVIYYSTRVVFKLQHAEESLRDTFFLSEHILLGVRMKGGDSMRCSGDCHADVDDMIFSEEVCLPSDR